MDLSVRIPSAGQSTRPVGGCGHEHVVEFYETEEFLVDTVCGFVGPALLDGDVAIIVATAAHRSAFDSALRTSGVDLTAAGAADRYLTFDASELLATFMVDGSPDPGLFETTIGGVIDRASADGHQVRIYGEMVAVLWDAGDVVSAIALEDLWNELATTREFSLLCAYPMTSFEDDASAAAFKRVCDQHTTVIPSEGYSLLDGADEQQRAVAALQQELATLRSDVERLRLSRHEERGAGTLPALGLGDNTAARVLDTQPQGAGTRAAATAERAAEALNRQEAALVRRDDLQQTHDKE